MYSVQIENNGSSVMKVKSKEYEFLIDTEGHGVTPPDTLLASLASCIGVYIRKYADGMKISIPGFKINISAELEKEKPVCFKVIKASIALSGIELDDKKKESLLRFIKNCPVHNTLKSMPLIEATIV